MGIEWLFKDLESVLHEEFDTFPESIIYLDPEQLSELYSKGDGSIFLIEDSMTARPSTSRLDANVVQIIFLWGMSYRILKTNRQIYLTGMEVCGLSIIFDKIHLF